MAEQQDLAGIIKNIQSDVRTIVRGEIELVKAELVPQAKSAGIGAGLLGGAAYLAITGALLLFFGLSFLLSLGFQSWFSLTPFGAAAWGFCIMALLLVLLAGVLALLARQKMVFSKQDASIDQAALPTTAVSTAVKSAIGRANALPLTGGPAPKPELE